MNVLAMMFYRNSSLCIVDLCRSELIVFILHYFQYALACCLCHIQYYIRAPPCSFLDGTFLASKNIERTLAVQMILNFRK